MIFKEIFKNGKQKVWNIYKEQARKDHKLNYLFWECTLNCNFRCQHCGSRAGDEYFKDELTTEEIKNCFADIAKSFKSKEIMLAITGGEPLLRKDLFEVMGFASKLGFPWGLVTNGFLVNEDNVKKLKDAGLSSLVVSIDGISEVHDSFRGLTGSYDRAIDAVKLFAKENFLQAFQITTSVHQGNINQLEEIYQEFLPLGINSWRLMNVDPIGRAEGNKDLLLTDEQLVKLLEFIKEKNNSSKIEVKYGCAGYLGPEFEGEVRPHLFSCNAGINSGSILHNGDIFVCPNVPHEQELIQGNVRKDSFVDVWNNKFEFFRDKNRTKCDKCASCQSWEECLGGSMHLWDFENQRPKFCHLEIINKNKI